LSRYLLRGDRSPFFPVTVFFFRDETFLSPRAVSYGPFLKFFLTPGRPPLFRSGFKSHFLLLPFKVLLPTTRHGEFPSSFPSSIQITHFWDGGRTSFFPHGMANSSSSNLFFFKGDVWGTLFSPPPFPSISPFKSSDFPFPPPFKIFFSFFGKLLFPTPPPRPFALPLSWWAFFVPVFLAAGMPFVGRPSHLSSPFFPV